MPRSDKRDLLVTTALELFARDGFHATGIDRIANQAGVSKKTLYNHFRSKEELVLAVLAHYDSSFRNGFIRQVEAAAKSPKARLLAVYDVAGHWFGDRAFFGCLFVNAIGEYSESDTELRRACQGFKRRMRRYLKELVTDAGIEPVDAISEELALLFEGAIATAQVAGSPSAARTAKRIARKVLAEIS